VRFVSALAFLLRVTVLHQDFVQVCVLSLPAAAVSAVRFTILEFSLRA